MCEPTGSSANAKSAYLLYVPWVCNAAVRVQLEWSNIYCEAMQINSQVLQMSMAVPMLICMTHTPLGNLVASQTTCADMQTGQDTPTHHPVG